MLEVFVQRKKEDVEPAIVQFVARRSYRLSRPWYLDGIRIEAHPDSEGKGGFWSAVLDTPTVARIDLEVKRKRSGTRVRIVIANTPESTRLAYELHAYLLDPRSFDQKLPAICPRCSTPIINVTARFCGRCGTPLATDAIAPPAPSSPATAAQKSKASADLQPVLPPPIIPVRPATERTPPETDREDELDDVEVLPEFDLVDDDAAEMERDAVDITAGDVDAEQSFERTIKAEAEANETEEPARSDGRSEKDAEPGRSEDANVESEASRQSAEDDAINDDEIVRDSNVADVEQESESTAQPEAEAEETADDDASPAAESEEASDDEPAPSRDEASPRRLLAED